MSTDPVSVITSPPEEVPVPSSSDAGAVSTDEVPNGARPLGLEQLESLEGFHVRLLMKPLENYSKIFSSDRTSRYEVLDLNGQPLFYATRNSEIWNGYCWKRRPLIRWLSLSGVPILTLTPSNRFECFALGFGCMKLKLRSGNGVDEDSVDLGSVTRVETCFTRPKFVLRDEAGKVVALIIAPTCADSLGFCRIGECCCDPQFRILLPDRLTQIGLIQQMSTEAEVMSGEKCWTFDATFDANFGGLLMPKLKILILAGVSVIDDAYFGLTPQGH